MGHFSKPLLKRRGPRRNTNCCCCFLKIAATALGLASPFIAYGIMLDLRRQGAAQLNYFTSDGCPLGGLSCNAATKDLWAGDDSDLGNVYPTSLVSPNDNIASITQSNTSSSFTLTTKSVYSRWFWQPNGTATAHGTVALQSPTAPDETTEIEQNNQSGHLRLS